MLPYEILVGLRRSVNVSARGLIGKQKVLGQPKIDAVQGLCNYPTYRYKYYSQLFYKDVKINNVKPFHIQVLAYCKATAQDARTTHYTEESHLPVEDNLGTPIEELGNNTSKWRHNKNIKIDSTAVQKWLSSDIEQLPSKDIEKKFLEPKVFLNNIYGIVSNETKIAHCLTSTSVPIHKKKNSWLFTYHVKWPEEKSFSTLGNSKASASMSAALKILHWLDINNRLKGRTPVLYEKKEQQSIIKAPEELKVETSVLEKVNNFLDINEKNINDIIKQELTHDLKDHLIKQLSTEKHPILNNFVNDENRNEILLKRLHNRKSQSNGDLPIFQFKEQILKELEENQAIVIKGDTGCGKTTQVPQFIIDSFTLKGQASKCNMIVTQPRRISAISLAERVAYERNETVGDVVGYQVRLQQVLPSQEGAILFCTTGILLKKLQKNFYLEGCSHIIIDEAHERTVDTDMLLVLLKRAMQANPSLKVIIMSATINADLFQKYLNCNSVQVPGRLFPVKMHFLEDIDQLISPSYSNVTNEENGAFIDTNRVTNLIQWISENKPPGSILCFLPGWSQISRIQKNLEYLMFKKLVLPLHSKIPYNEQSKIFESPQEGVRKIILATDIAETGITVPDVVYVIDTSCHKGKIWHESRGLSSIKTSWISKANINQRKGRAGRVQEGESFHFVTKQQYNQLDPYPLPEVLRVSLERTVLDGKIYSNESAENFLGSMPQPPRLSAVTKAVRDLQELGALDKEENLTALGKLLSKFSIHPKLSKAMIYGTIFECLSPVSTVASVLSLDFELFYGVLDNKSHIRNTKMHFHPTSDHLAFAWIYNQWYDYHKYRPHQAFHFSKKHGLHAERMNTLQKIRDINLEPLFESRLIRSIYDASNLKSNVNKFAVLDELVRGILLAGMDQILKHRNFEIRKGRFTKTGTSMVTEEDAKAQLSPECLNYRNTSWPSPYLIYYQKTHHDEMRTTLIRESSMISPVTVLLFSQGLVTGSMTRDENTGEKSVVLEISGKKNVQLKCDEITAKTLLRFRDLMWSVARYYVERNVSNKDAFHLTDLTVADSLMVYKKEMLMVLASLLSSSSKDIDNIEKKKKNYISIFNDSQKDM